MPADTPPASRLCADPDDVHTVGAALATHADDLAAVAATLRSMPSPAALGPVAERFVAAFTDAVARHGDAVAALGERAATGSQAAIRSAAGYTEAGRRAVQLLPQV